MHESIRASLDLYLKNECVPNLLFFGPIGSGKKTLVEWFIQRIFDADKERITQYTLWVNCAYGKGIKFIRENLKHFAKTNVCDARFKIIILHNADKLTSDAQSALRRCIEEFSFNTRFFMITTNKYKLLKPILSRLSEIYVPQNDNLHQLQVMQAFPRSAQEKARLLRLRAVIKALTPESNLAQLTQALIDDAYSAVDIAHYVEVMCDMDTVAKYTWLMYYTKIKSDFRNEAMLMFVLLHWLTHPGDFRPELGVLSPM